jgi:VWFA-related protein
MLVDTSGSMYSRMSDVRAAANHLLDILPDGDQICLASFGWHLEMRRHFTQDRTKIAASIQALNAEGGTSLRDALVGLEDSMRGAAKNRLRAIVVLTDGADNASDADEQQMRRAMESAGSPVVHIVRVPPPQGGTTYRSEEASDKGTVRRIAAISGGLSYFPKDAAEMNASLDDLIRSMKSVYLLTYSTGVAPRDGRERSLEIKLDKAHGGSKAVVWAPERFYAPSE